MPSSKPNPIFPFLVEQAVMILDGGLATTLEDRGCNLNHDLWSARVLVDNPELIREVYRDFLTAGADCLASISYQATIEGFRRSGFTEEESVELLNHSVELALDARDQFWANGKNRVGRLKPLVAASVGPYGAFLADGSEYTGDYGLSVEELRDFHWPRWHVLAGTEADLLACETIPNLPETRALLELLRSTPHRWAWLSFSCRDDGSLRDGTPLREVAELCEREEQVAAVGVNCVAPEWVPRLLQELRRGTTKPLLVYPNSGETYDAVEKVWRDAPTPEVWETAPLEWVSEGASVVGGCCRTAPETIKALRRRLID